MSFNGGLHILGHKTIINQLPVLKIGGTKTHIFPLQQHIGVPLDSLVKEGETVYKGQMIANSDSFLSVPLHSSISGTVSKIAPHPHPDGTTVASIFIENDFKDEVHPDIRPCTGWEQMTPEELLGVIRQAGIVGMGGAGFPTHVKLTVPVDKKITHIIINGAECEPYLTSDHRRMVEDPDKILNGLEIAMKILGLGQGTIAIEKNKPDAIEILSQKAAERGNINVVPLKTKYPQGAEKQLIYSVTRRRVPSGKLPSDVGAIVLNVDTAAAIDTAFTSGMPLTERIITLSGDCFQNPCNVLAPIGMPFSYLVEIAGGFSKQPKKIIAGGPMMGTAQYTLDVPVVKTTSCLLALSKAVEPYQKDTPCIRCGKCISHCPMGLSPLYLSKYALEDDWEKCEKYHIMDCIECGICSYLCPGLQSPLQNIRRAKQQILENRRKQR